MTKADPKIRTSPQVMRDQLSSAQEISESARVIQRTKSIALDTILATTDPEESEATAGSDHYKKYSETYQEHSLLTCYVYRTKFPRQL